MFKPTHLVRAHLAASGTNSRCWLHHCERLVPTAAALHSPEGIRLPEASKGCSNAVSLTLTAEAYQQEGRYCAAQDDLEDARCGDNTDNGDMLMVCVRQDLPF